MLNNPTENLFFTNDNNNNNNNNNNDDNNNVVSDNEEKKDNEYDINSIIKSNEEEEGDDKPVVVLHIHGGGWISQSPKTHLSYLYSWAVQSDIPILSIDYCSFFFSFFLLFLYFDLFENSNFNYELLLSIKIMFKLY